MSINEWHTNTGSCSCSCSCSCNNCYEYRCREMDKIKIKKITPIGTLINDGEDGCFVDYDSIAEEIKKKGLVTNSASYDMNKVPNIQVRKFDTGAIRDTSEGKLEYARFNSPLVMKRYAEYMDLHRKQSDGNLREPDNWQNLFGNNHEDVCLDSLMRHLMDVWLINKGFPKEAREDIESALCAILFNTNAYLFKVLLDKQKGKESNV